MSSSLFFSEKCVPHKYVTHTNIIHFKLVSFHFQFQVPSIDGKETPTSVQSKGSEDKGKCPWAKPVMYCH